MPLIKCSECKKKISDKAPNCPHCGCPIEAPKDNVKPKKKGRLVKVILWVIGFVLYLSLLTPVTGIVLTILLIGLIGYLHTNKKFQSYAPNLLSSKRVLFVGILGFLAIVHFYSSFSHERQILANQKANNEQVAILTEEYTLKKNEILNEAQTLASNKNYSDAIKKLERYLTVAPELTAQIATYKEDLDKQDYQRRLTELLAKVAELEVVGNYSEIVKVASELKDDPQIKVLYEKAETQILEEKAKNLVAEVTANFDAKNYDEVISATRIYKSSNPVLGEFFAKAVKIKTNEILEKLRKVPSSDLKGNLDLYRELVDFNPDNKSYQATRDKFSEAYAKVELKRKAKEEAQLELVKWSWGQSYSNVIAEGQVKNLTGLSLNNIQAVVSFYDKNGGFITADSALIEYRPLLSGQTSPFKVFATWNPAMNNATIEFKELMGTTFIVYNEKRFK